MTVLSSVAFVWAVASTGFALQPVQSRGHIESIKQTVNMFPLVVDGQLLNQFDKVFTPNATANLHPPSGQVFYGIPEIVQSIAGLANVSSQHGFTTQHVEMLSSTTANATIYLFANFYGKGAQQGQIYTVYGM